jgi:hypothetical protein
MRQVTPQSHGHRLRHSSKPYKSTAQRRLIESEVHLLARPPMRKAKCQLFLGTTSRGACVAPLRARQASVLIGAERPRGHMEPLSSSGELRTLSLASCRHRRGATSKPCSEARGLRLGRRNERANALPSPFESEASLETGSFRRRAPVAACSSPARAANDSIPARATPFSAFGSDGTDSPSEAFRVDCAISQRERFVRLANGVAALRQSSHEIPSLRRMF